MRERLRVDAAVAPLRPVATEIGRERLDRLLQVGLDSARLGSGVAPLRRRPGRSMLAAR